MGSLDGLLDDLAHRPPAEDEGSDLERCARAREILLASEDVVGDVFEATGGGEQVAVGSEAALASVPEAKGRLLYRLARLVRPDRVVELGSAFGLSGSYLASALETVGNGELVTVEGSPSRHRIAAETIESVVTGRARCVLGLFDDHLHELEGAALVFIDGNHQPDPTRRYVAAAREVGADPCIMVLDDVRGWSEEFTSMWQDLAGDSAFSQTGEAAGVGVLVCGEAPSLGRPRSGLSGRLRSLVHKSKVR